MTFTFTLVALQLVINPLECHKFLIRQHVIEKRQRIWVGSSRRFKNNR